MTSRLISKQVYIYLCLTIMAFNSCVKKNIDLNDMSDQQWTPELAVPLVNSSFTIKDILIESDKNGNISIDPTTGFCTLIYRGNLISVRGSDLIPLTTQTVSSNYSLSAGDVAGINALPTNSSYTVNYNSSVNYSTGNSTAKIDELTLKTGNLALTLNSTIKQNCVLHISIPSAKKNNVAFSQFIIIPASTGSPVSVNINYDLSSYVFDMTNGGTSTNKFDVNYSIVATKTAANSSVSESLKLTESFSNQSFSLLKGDVGQQSIVAKIDTVDISIFKNMVPGGGSFKINYATIKFIINNSYGIPIRLTNIQLAPYGVGQTFPAPIVPLPAAYNNLDINAPTIVGDSAYTYPPKIGGPLETTLNSIINSKPKSFIYSAASKTNPLGVPPSNARNFITDKSKFNIDMEFALPLDGAAWDFVFADTIAFNFGSQNADKINSLLIRNYVDNGMPFDVNMNLDFVDSNYVVKQTLSPGVAYADIIKSGIIDGNGKVISSTIKTTDFVLTKDQINNLKTVKHVIVRAKGNTYNSGVPNVKIYDYYKLNVRIGVKGEFNIPLKQ